MSVTMNHENHSSLSAIASGKMLFSYKILVRPGKILYEKNILPASYSSLWSNLKKNNRRIRRNCKN